MDIEEKVNHWKREAEHVFAICNGWINPINPAISLSFRSISNNEDESFRYLGECNINEIIIDLIGIFEFCIKRNFNTEEQVRAIIDYTIIHELSHCDQKFSHTLPILSQEVANDRNVAQFVVDNKSLLEARLGYCLDNLLFEYIKSKIDNSINYPYIKINRPYDKLLELIVPFCEHHEHLIDKFDSILLRSIDSGFSHYIKLNGQITPLLISIEFIKHIIKDCKQFRSVVQQYNNTLVLTLQRLV